ncbi:MAG: Hpt domain-containing protein [Gemmatimonadales bacterium]|nr:MAG: Hpt domain-containing protein [Gemmatimonadales bacterium]
MRPRKETEGTGVLLDPAAFVRLREWGGDELLQKMIELFLKNAPQRMEEVRQGMASGDVDAVERGSHSLKSSAGNLGAEALRLGAARVEALAEDGTLVGDPLRQAVKELESAWGRTEAALREARDRGKEEA